MLIAIDLTAGWEPKDSISIIAQMLVFAALIIGVVRYSKEKKREFQKRFFDEQFKLYAEAVDYAAIISTHNKDEEKYKDAVRNFERLYFGKMCLVENVDVEKKMFDFYKLMNDYHKENDAMSQRGINILLQNACISLAHSCRKSSLQTWGIDLVDGLNNYNLEERKNNF